jgi:hypothetical protein
MLGIFSMDQMEMHLKLGERSAIRLGWSDLRMADWNYGSSLDPESIKCLTLCTKSNPVLAGGALNG